MTSAEAIRTAALSAAAINAEHYNEMLSEGMWEGPFADSDDAAGDDVHTETIQEAFGREMTDDEYAIAWPIYRAEMVRLTTH